MDGSSLLDSRPASPERSAGARDTAFFTTAQSEGPSFGTEVKKLGCIPWAKHTLSMAASSVNFRRSTGPCNINAISTVESVDVAFSRLTFAHLVEDAAPLAPVVNAFVGLVASLTGAFIIHSIDKKHDTIALPVGIVCASLFIVRIIIWYFFRSCEATFGAPGVDCKQTCVNFSAAEKDEMKSTFLANTYAIARPGAHVNPEQNAKSWTHAYKTFMCIPAGEDTLTIGDKHIEIYKSSGTCCKKSKESFTIMQSSVKWLHFSSSGRNCVHLFVGLVLGPLWPFWLLYWLGNTSHSMDMSFLGAPPGGGLPGAPSLYNGTWQCVVPTEGVTGETASEDIMFEMLSRKSGKECRKAEPLHSWKGKGGDKASSVLELHDCYILLRKTAKGCCGKTDTYVMLLKDIQHLETFVGVNNMLLLFAFVQLIGCVIAGVVLSQTTNDGDYLTYGGGGSAALWLLLVIAYICSKTAVINVGVNPGGGENGTLNPRGSSPFWVPFKPQTNDVTKIIPQIRAQMERAGA